MLLPLFLNKWIWFLVPEVVAHIFISTAELAIPTGAPTNEAKVETETQPLTDSRNKNKKMKQEKHITFYTFDATYILSPQHFSSLFFKTVNGSCVDNIIRKAASVFYISVIEKNLTYCCFEGWFFQLEIMSSSYQIMISCIFCRKIILQ